jgi:hypothetical protein
MYNELRLVNLATAVIKLNRVPYEHSRIFNCIIKLERNQYSTHSLELI